MSIEAQLAQVAQEIREMRSAQSAEQNTSTSRLLTTAEAADILRVRPKTVRAHISAGRLSAVRFGRSFRIREDDLAAFIAAGPKIDGDVALVAKQLLEG